MRISRPTDEQSQFEEKDVIFSITMYSPKGAGPNDIGVHMESGDDVEDPQILECVVTLLEVLGQTKTELEHKILGKVLDNARLERKHRKMMEGVDTDDPKKVN